MKQLIILLLFALCLGIEIPSSTPNECANRDQIKALI